MARSTKCRIFYHFAIFIGGYPQSEACWMQPDIYQGGFPNSDVQWWVLCNPWYTSWMDEARVTSKAMCCDGDGPCQDPKITIKITADASIEFLKKQNHVQCTKVNIWHQDERWFSCMIALHHMLPRKLKSTWWTWASKMPVWWSVQHHPICIPLTTNGTSSNKSLPLDISFLQEIFFCKKYSILRHSECNQVSGPKTHLGHFKSGQLH